MKIDFNVNLINRNQKDKFIIKIFIKSILELKKDFDVICLDNRL